MEFLTSLQGSNINLTFERSYPTPLSNSTLLPLLVLSLARQKNSPDTSLQFKDEYDYIVVGAGSTGSVVASRLSEIPCVNVLLLEAGHAPPKLNDVPALGLNFWLTDLDWQFKTAPQKYTGNGLKDRQLNWPSGKALGGSSILNDGLYVRGNKQDYEDWAAMGADGWSYNDVLPYFKKMEENKDPEYIINGYHGVNGPVTVMKPSYEPEMKQPIADAARDMKYAFVDPNAQTQTGFYDLQDNLRDSQRCSTAKAYLVPAENRENLDILPNAMVEKIIIENNRATGVQFAFKDQIYRVKAKREVILSAGTTNSAQLLMLSGIGPKEELQKFNIPVYADLPVGFNFHDHGGTHLDFVLNTEIQPILKKIVDPINIQRYINDRTGPLAGPENCNTLAFLYNEETQPVFDYPNYELHFVETTTQMAKEQLNLRPEVYQQVYGPYEDKPLMSCLIYPLHPKSRGRVTLRSANPYDSPIIDPNYLEDPADVEALVNGMKVCTRILTNNYTKAVVSYPFQTLYPGCEMYAGDEGRYFECQARTELFTFSHHCCTARMGNLNDTTTVVDPQLRVKNIEGLRVVDNSIMPKVTGGNTNVPAIMIGEKASDIIKKTIQCNIPQNHVPQIDLLPPQFETVEVIAEDTEMIPSAENRASYEGSAISVFPQNNDYRTDNLQPPLENTETHGSISPIFQWN